MKKYLFFLDDIREVYNNGTPLQNEKQYQEDIKKPTDIFISRDFQEFCDSVNEFVQNNQDMEECKIIFSFDHDLDDFHEQSDNQYGIYHSLSNVIEYSGFSALKWLIDNHPEMVLNQNTKIYFHTMNHIAKDNMMAYLQSFYKVNSI